MGASGAGRAGCCGHRASRRFDQNGATGREVLDIWPPLLGTIVLQAFTFAVYLLADPLVGDVPPTIRLLVLLAAQGGLIWLFAAWRGRADGAEAGPLGAEILVCSGALLLSLVLGVGGPMSGCWLILCVAAGLSVASGKAQVAGGLSGPMPTADLRRSARHRCVQKLDVATGASRGRKNGSGIPCVVAVLLNRIGTL